MRTKNPGLALLEKKVDELGLRREVEEDLAQILIEHKVADLGKGRGLTQAALVRRSGVSQPMIAQIESGKLNNLTLKTLARTVRALGASLKDRLGPAPCIGETWPGVGQESPWHLFPTGVRAVTRPNRSMGAFGLGLTAACLTAARRAPSREAAELAPGAWCMAPRQAALPADAGFLILGAVV